jgi:SEP domain
VQHDTPFAFAAPASHTTLTPHLRSRWRPAFIARRPGQGEGGGGAGGDSTVHTIYMYRQGFVVDDGPFRRLDDPANETFLKDLAKGSVTALCTLKYNSSVYTPVV